MHIPLHQGALFSPDQPRQKWCKSVFAGARHCIWVAEGHSCHTLLDYLHRGLPAGSAHLHASSDIHDLSVDIAGLCRPTQDLSALCVRLALRTVQALAHSFSACKEASSQCRSAELAPRSSHSHSNKKAPKHVHTCSIRKEDKRRSQLCRLPSTVSRSLAASKGFYLHVQSIVKRDHCGVHKLSLHNLAVSALPQ